MKKKPKKVTLKEILSAKYTLDDVIETEAYKEAEKVADADVERHLEAVAKYIGRNLTRSEEKAICGIVEKYSPKDEEGYITLYSSFIQAWKIYEKRGKRFKKARSD